MSDKNKNADPSTEDKNKGGGAKAPELLTQEQFAEMSPEEQLEELNKAKKKSFDQEGRANKAETALKNVNDAANLEDPQEEPKETEEKPAGVSEEEVDQKLLDSEAMRANNVTEPEDVEFLDKYRGNMTRSEALADPNIRGLVAKQTADRLAKGASDSVVTIAGTHTAMTDSQFMEEYKAGNVERNKANASRYGRLLAQRQ